MLKRLAERLFGGDKTRSRDGKLIPIGFYRECGKSIGCPSLVDALRAEAHPDAEQIVAYLQKAPYFVFSPGVEADVFTGQGHAGSGSTRTDGFFAWPDSLPYYVVRYHVALPEAFLAHGRKRQWQIPEGLEVRGLDMPRPGGDAPTEPWQPAHFEDTCEYQVVVTMTSSLLKAHGDRLRQLTGRETRDLFKLAKARVRVTLLRGGPRELHAHLVDLHGQCMAFEVVPPYPWELKLVVPVKAQRIPHPQRARIRVRGKLVFGAEDARDESARALYRLIPVAEVNLGTAELQLNCEIWAELSAVDNMLTDATLDATRGALHLEEAESHYMHYFPARGLLEGFADLSFDAETCFRAILDRDSDGVELGREVAADCLDDLVKGYWRLTDDKQKACFGALVCDCADPRLDEVAWDLLELQHNDDDDYFDIARFTGLCVLERSFDLGFEFNDRERLEAAVRKKLTARKKKH